MWPSRLERSRPGRLGGRRDSTRTGRGKGAAEAAYMMGEAGSPGVGAIRAKRALAAPVHLETRPFTGFVRLWLDDVRS